MELRRLRMMFGNPTTDKLVKLLKRYKVEDIGPDTGNILEFIKNAYGPCQRYAQKPRRLK